jgi:PAS domain S-box-containing protein
MRQRDIPDRIQVKLMISVLYVDDEPGLLELCQIFLEETGEFRVETAVSGMEALALLQKKHYDAIIADYQMPGMDGITLLKSIRSGVGDLPFILFTGRGREEVVIEALNNGADFYLQKGGDPRAQFAELMHKVRQSVSKKNAEKNLRESEKRLTDIINFLPDATFAIDPEGRVIAWNRAIEELTGIPATEMLGKGDKEYAIPFYGHRRPILIDLVFESDERIAERYSGIVRQKDILIAETDMPRLKGKQLTLMGKASPLYDQNGNIVGAIESIRDITSRKMAEDELRAACEEISATEEELRDQYDKLTRNEQVLRESEEKYRTLVENSRDVIYIYHDDRFLVINRRGPELTGYSFEELMTMSVWDFLHPDDRARVSASGMARMRGENLPTQFTARIVTKSGQTIPMEFIAILISYQGRPAIMGIARDVTEREKHSRDMARKTKTLMIINQIIQTSGQKRTMEEVLTTILASTRDLLGYDAGGIYLVSEGESRARIVCSQNLPQEFVSEVDNIEINKTPYNAIFARGHPIFGEHYETLSPERARKYNFASMASIPVTSEERIIGALNLVSLHRHEIPAEERDVLLMIGKELGSAIMRMKAENALQESEARYRTLLETTGTGYVILDDLGRVTDANAEYVRLSGQADLREITGRSVLEWTAPYEKEKNAAAFRECLEIGFIRNFEIDYVNAVGVITPVEINATVVPGKGSPLVVTLCRDISSRRNAEKALLESEASLSSIFRATPVGIGVVSDRILVRVNDRLCEMAGYSRDELVGTSARILYPADEDFEYVGREKYRQIRDHGTGTVETRWRRKDGSVRDILLSSTPVDQSTPTINVTFTALDITDQIRAQEGLRESEREYRSIMENMQDMFYRTDLQGRIVKISPSGASLLGYNSPEEMIGLDMARDLYDDGKERKKFLARVAKYGSVTSYPLVLRARDGHRIYTIVSSHSHHDAQGNVVGIEGIVHDVTHLKQEEDALKEANRKVNILSNVTRHDIVNQLTVLHGYSQLGMMKNQDPVIGDFLKKIDTVTTMIGRQIEFSKAYQELGMQAPGWFRLQDILSRAKPKDILFSNSCSDIEIFADPMLEKVFTNLFGNSVMHGERVTRIAISCCQAGNEFLLTIEDNGIGIPLNEKQKIFNKGYGKNTGFGLFLSREILAITGISIHETGKHGSGARFEITIPKNGFRPAGTELDLKK